MDAALDYHLATSGGHRYWVNPSTGRVLPYIAGGDGEDDPPDPKLDEPKTFTQAEVDRMVGRARGEAKRSAASELADELGCTVEEAKAKIAATAAAEDEAKSEAQKEREAAARDRADAETEKFAAKRDRFEAKIERRLVAAGVGAGIEDAKKAASTIARAVRLVDLEPDADDDEITAEIATLKDEVPGLFGPVDDEKKPPRRTGLAPVRPPAATGLDGKSLTDRGNELRKQHRLKTA